MLFGLLTARGKNNYETGLLPWFGLKKGHQDSSPINSRQDDMPYLNVSTITHFWPKYGINIILSFYACQAALRTHKHTHRHAGLNSILVTKPGNIRVKWLEKLYSLQNKCRTTDPEWQNLGRSGKLSFFLKYKFWQNCASVLQVSDLILKIDHTDNIILKTHVPINVFKWESLKLENFWCNRLQHC